MHKLVLVLVSFVDIESVVERSFEMITGDDELEVIGFVQEPSNLSDLILEVGFLGKKVVQDVKTTVEQEHEERAQRNLALIAAQGQQYNRQVTTKLMAEESLEDLHDELGAQEEDYVIINYPRDEHCTGDVETQSVKEIVAKLDVPCEVYYDGEREREAELHRVGG